MKPPDLVGFLGAGLDERERRQNAETPLLPERRVNDRRKADRLRRHAIDLADGLISEEEAGDRLLLQSIRDAREEGLGWHGNAADVARLARLLRL